MASGTGSHPTRISPRKFSEKIALLNKKERETNKNFEEIIKEVQATKQQQHPYSAQQSIDGYPIETGGVDGGLTLLQDELGQMIDTGYQAVHAESLEEIEKVYENLMESVGQYDVENSQQENSLYQRVPPYNGGNVHDDEMANMKSSTIYHQTPNQPDNKRRQVGALDSTAFISASAPFYEQQSDSNLISTSSRTDLNGGNHAHQQQSIACGPAVGLCETTSSNFLQGHGRLDICVSASCDQPPPPQQQQQQQNLASSQHHLGSYLYGGGALQQPTTTTSCRARVVSFGSASRQKYPCATSNLLNQQDSHSHSSSRQQIHRHHEDQTYHTQYLKEPSGERSRQKSCSDPQLHITPNQHMLVNSVVQCNSENRLADHEQQQQQQRQHQIENSAAIEHPHSTTMDCCDAVHAPANHARSQQDSNEAAYKLAYACSANLVPADHKEAKTILVTDNDQQQQQIVHKTSSASSLHSRSSVAGPGAGFSCQSPNGDAGADHIYGMCDTSSTRGQLPGIKICTIDDADLSLAGGRNSSLASGQLSRSSSHPNDSAPSSRDGSLPDISNLRFGTNSTAASPEREIDGKQQYQQQQSWQQPDTSHVDRQFIPCQLSGTHTGGWSSYDEARAIEHVEMDVQDGPPPLYMQSARQQPQQSSHARDAVHVSRCWQASGAQQQQQQQQQQRQPFVANPLQHKVNNTLSSSDCGFADTSPFHQQQGSLMICTSGDFYNNIIRSRSHSNISSINPHSKRNQHAHYSGDPTLPLVEQHHTSQYSLQACEQPNSMNVRRIAELKACGSSTSPLDSSSNLNSPQSEMNSPGSSTTEQCEAAAMMTASAAQHLEPCHQFPPPPPPPTGILANGSSSTLVADGVEFLSQYTPTGASVPGQAQLIEAAAFGQDVCNQTHQ